MSKTRKKKDKVGGERKGKTPQKKVKDAVSRPKGYFCFDFSGDTNQGLRRNNNEDDFVCQKIWERNAILAVVIDGLGGYEGGEVATQIAKEEIVNNMEASSNGECLELLKQAVASANNAIFEASQNEPNYYQMGCVLTAIIVDIDNKKVYMAHVGDSRLYCFNEDRLEKLSHDHSVVGYMEDNHELSEEAAMHHPQRNVVDRVLGHEYHLASDKNFIEAKEFPLHNNSMLLLCSDGLTDMITSSTISSVLRKKDSLKGKVSSLINAALEAGGNDNVTVVLVEYMKDKTETIKVPPQDTHHVVDNQQNNTPEEDNLALIDKKKRKISWWFAITFLVFGFMAGFLCGRESVSRSKMDTEEISGELKSNTSIKPVVDVMEAESASLVLSKIDTIIVDTSLFNN